MMKQIWFDERGASTAEYAIITLAAVGFAGLLLTILRSPEVRQMLMDLIKSALTVNGTG
jgi:Flp pilus assembly pilin Flp